MCAKMTRERGEEFGAAWNSGNADLVASFFADDGAFGERQRRRCPRNHDWTIQSQDQCHSNLYLTEVDSMLERATVRNVHAIVDLGVVRPMSSRPRSWVARWPPAS
jgi:hypothetical protein